MACAWNENELENRFILHTINIKESSKSIFPFKKI
jgi:hypothetical protein